MHRTHNQQLNNCTCVFAVINDAAEPDGDEARAEKPQVNESAKQESNYVDGFWTHHRESIQYSAASAKTERTNQSNGEQQVKTFPAVM